MSVSELIFDEIKDFHGQQGFQVYTAHQQMDKYGSAGSVKDRLGGGAQATPPPQVYQQGYMNQQMALHGHKKAYGSGPQHWSSN